ncbi:MAG TPA: hypothetical protein VMD30_07545, partial [Tepidisphaeraceae bacterium]|nr:hypothetical protein [Tepidisphaeraceae bacterium]
LIATGSGFIFFADQPMTYLAGYAAYMILAWMFYRLLVRESSWGSAVLFGSLLALGLLTTDFYPFAIFMLLYSFVMRLRPWRVILALIVAGGISAAFVRLLPVALNSPLDTYNSSMTLDTLIVLKQRLISHQGAQWAPLTAEFFRRLGMDFALAFFALPLLLALLGFFALRRRGIAVALALLLPACVTLVVLHFGDGKFEFSRTQPAWPLAALPRLVYIAYPAVYLLAAAALTAWGWQRRWAGALPWAFLLAIFVLNNVDVFGFPRLYFHFYYGFDPALPRFGWP